MVVIAVFAVASVTAAGEAYSWWWLPIPLSEYFVDYVVKRLAISRLERPESEINGRSS